MKKLILLTFLGIISTFTVFSQSIVERNVGDFNRLKVYDLLNIELIKSSINKVEISGEFPSFTIVKNKNGELKIRMGLEKRFRGSKTNVKLYYKKIDKINTHEGAIVFSKDTIKQEKIVIKADSGSIQDYILDVKDISTKINTGSIVYLTGKTDRHIGKITTGGELNAEILKSEQSKIYVNTGSIADVSAKDLLELNIRTGGIVNVYSKTKRTKENIRTGGKVVYVDKD
tara:strand:+ start:59 stop:745 length:687 start_codon:yes stop_codon:yes gene_type:complete